eukprot:TRINITY_DN17308_c0_g2_i1.p1 TRINITY_DN17308_c0_g2~~TRINITY_DN17308_c0_g2_i1.p1  ORF type:complete len:540 (+),score=83.19 TRINITY_DN17308_c0_g2_i1:94-1713(+)
MAVLRIEDWLVSCWHGYKLLISTLPWGSGIIPSVLIAGLVSLLWISLTSDPYPNVPGPKPHFFLGSVYEILCSSYIDAHLKWRKMYGHVYKVRLFMTQWSLVVSDPELVKEILVKNFKVFHDRVITFPKNDMDHRGLLASSGGYWAGLRSALLPMFHTEKLRQFGSIMSRAAATMISKLAPFADREESVDIVQFTQRLTTDVILESSFGVQFYAQEGSEQATGLLHDFNNRFASVMAMRTSRFLSLLLPPIQPIAYWVAEHLPWTIDYKFAKSRTNIFKFVHGLVQDRYKDPKLMERNDFFSMLLQARTKDSNRNLTDEEIGAAVTEFLLAGQETTALAISYCIYLVSKHPSVESKVTEEVDHFFDELREEATEPDKEGIESRPNYDDLSKFPYLEMVINEALRMYPPGAILSRKAVEDIKLGNHVFKKGATIFIPTYTMLHDETLFPQPFEFKPERFAPGEGEKGARHSYAFLPFGAGPRVCIGSRFALEEAKITLVHLYKNFTFTVDEEKLNNRELELDVGLTIRPKHGIPVRVHRR